MTTRPDKIVITGIGLVTALGLTPDQTWQAMLEGRPGIGTMPALEVPAPPEKGGYQAVDLPADFAQNLPREVRYLRWTISQALTSAGVAQTLPYPAKRCGFILGTTLHGMRSAGEFLRTGDYGKLNSFMAGSTLQQAVAALALEGDSLTTCSACSSSLGSIALAVTMLETGQLDLVVAGGYDTVSEYAYGGFNSLRLVATGPLRPFAKQRLGMKLGEGYGIVVLERAANAENRNAKILATIAGCGESADAHHLTQPHPQGAGAAAAIHGALNSAGLKPSDIDLIAAHATGTPDNDSGEHAALANVFAEHLSAVPVVAFKSHLGHTLGGAGAVELILSALALRDQIIPACANITPEDIEFSDMSMTTSKPRSSLLKATLNTSLGFGGANTCTILTAAKASLKPAIAPTFQDVFITGIGVIVPGAVGFEAFRQMLANDVSREASNHAGAIPETNYAHLLNTRRVRRLSEYVKLTLAATTLACHDAGLSDPVDFDGTCPVLLGTAHGSATYCIDYYRQIVAGGLIAANPMLFAEGVPNAAAAHLSLMLSIKGSCQTVIGSRTAGLDALRLASIRIAGGQWDRAIVGAAEEFVPLVNDAYRHGGLNFNAGAGAVTLLLESGESIRRRGGKARGRIGRSANIRMMPGKTIGAISAVLNQLEHPDQVMGSANGTWIDRAEADAVHRGGDVSMLTNLYGQLPELFSAGPLASIAAILSAKDHNINKVTSRGVICTGYNGTVAGVCIEPAANG